MIENLITWTIIALCAFFIGRRFYRQWKAAVTNKGVISSCDGCSCCSDSACDDRKKQ